MLGVVFVASSLRQPEIPSYAPTPPGIHPAGDSLTGPRLFTIDASSADEWRFFDFSRGSVVTPAGPRDWDLAFRRFHIIANGGTGFSGNAGIIDLGTVAFDSVVTPPASGYVGSTARRDSVNAAIERWYDYSWTSHVLRPKPNVWVVRTADGRFAKLRILSYYCPGARPGCITFEYRRIGDWGTGEWGSE